MSSSQQLLLGEGAGGGAVANYIEDVFSTWLYTGTGATQTITNSIDLSTKGGLVWIKGRSGATANRLTDTARGVTKSIESNAASAQITEATGLTAFNTTGFTIGADADYNTNAATYVSWSFREQPKFFDVVTYTGDGTTPRSIPHNLGSTPGCVMIKMLSTSADWYVYHRGLSTTAGTYIRLNSTATTNANTTYFPASPVNSTTFKVGDNPDVNGSGSTYVAYLFAHNAGGFGLTGTDNVISCGSYSGNGLNDGPIITLGYEPQWVLIKRATGGTGDWYIADNMRGLTVASGSDPELIPNTTGAENSYFAGTAWIQPLATGFQLTDNDAAINASGSTYIYIAIRRGPMKVPTDATKVFGLSARTGTGAVATVTGGQTDDAVLIKNRGAAQGTLAATRLTYTGYMLTSSSAAEVAAGTTILQANPWDVMDGIKVGTTSAITNASGNTFINYLFKRAPSFFDVVCWSGTGSYPFTINHNLGVVPELMIFKSRSSAVQNWFTYEKPITIPNSNWYQSYMMLNSTAASTADVTSITSSPTSTAITFADYFSQSGDTWIAYLFATCPGVSKVGSYTGTGTTLQIDCGFTSGARFVMIKRADGAGAWYVWDTARGIVAGNDPYFLFNTTAAEVTSTDYIDTYSAGFEISSTAPAAINGSGSTYFFLAIA
jgi:hypothetical protein